MSHHISLSKKIVAAVIVATVLAVSGLTFYFDYWSKRPIKVGIMASLTGNMAVSEKGIVTATMMAISEINESGGVLGRQIEPIVLDGKSDPAVFAQITRSLINEHEVDAVFGCWTSSCRKTVLPIFEESNHLLYYPSQYEGLESSKNIVYLGSVPNQQVTPALEWVLSKLGKKIYLVGSDYVYPRATNQIIGDQARRFRAEIVGESYSRLGNEDFSSIIEEIKEAQPDVIFNTINGISNLHFFKALKEYEIDAAQIPVFSFSISESEIQTFRDVDMTGNFVVLSFLRDSNNAKNTEFIRRFQEKYGDDVVFGDTMEASYLGVRLWAQAVKEANSSQVDKVREVATGRSVQGPSGMLYLDHITQHAWKYMHISQINTEGLLESVWHSSIPVAPNPFPESRSPQQWQNFLEELRSGWNGYWEAPLPDSNL